MKNLARPLAAFIILLVAAGRVSAAPAAPGITISPPSQQVAITPGEESHEVNFKVTNNRPSAQSLQISTADFNTLEDTGGLVFVGANPTQLQKKYGLAQWLNIPQSSLSVPPHQTVIVKAQVLNLPSLSPGGHYGAILLHAPGQNSIVKGKNIVGLNPIGSILLFVNKVGGDIHKLRLDRVSRTGNTFKLPDSVTLRFYNSGNTHLTPRGVVTITDSSGKVVERGVINEDSSVILPEVYRLYTVHLAKKSNSHKTGRYHLNIAFRFDGFDQFRFYQTGFLLIGPIVVLGGFVVIVVLVSAVIFGLRRLGVKIAISGSKSSRKRS